MTIFKEETASLAVHKSGLRFHFRNRYLHQISLSANKVVELKENGLLAQDKLRKYNNIVLVNDKRTMNIPIIQGYCRFGGQKDGLLKFWVLSRAKITKKDLNVWLNRMQE